MRSTVGTTRRGPVAAADHAGELACNVGLTLSTAARHLGDDPLLLALEVSRFLPRPLVNAVARLLGGVGDRPHDREHPPVARYGRAGLRAAYGAWLGSRHQEAIRKLRALASDAGQVPAAGQVPDAGHVADASWGALQRRLYAELAVQLDQVDLVDASATPSIQARVAWQRGDVQTAIEKAALDVRHPALHDRLVSEVALLRMETGLTPVDGPRRAAPGVPVATSHPHPAGRVTGGRGVAALHLLTHSVPYAENGYAIRSHSVLLAQREAGIRVTAATPVGYPVTTGALRARHLDVVDEIPYLRFVPVRSAPTSTGRLRQQVELLLPAVGRFEPDVLHATTPYPNAIVARELARRLGVPWVYEVRGLLEEAWVVGRPAGVEQEHAAASERYRLIRAKETELAIGADAVVTLSETLRAELVARGLPAERITVVPSAVDAALLEPVRWDPGAVVRTSAEARAALGLPAAGFWVGTVGALADIEGLDALIDAVAELWWRGIDAQALLVGDGAARSGLEEHARRRGVANRVTFVGRVRHDRVPLYYQALDTVVIPRRDVRVCRRVTPLKAIEAMACGRPVVASDLPALAELVRGPDTGLLVPPDDPVALADALDALEGAPDLRRHYGLAGRAFAATRTWSRAGQSYRELYSRLG